MEVPMSLNSLNDVKALALDALTSIARPGTKVALTLLGGYLVLRLLRSGVERLQLVLIRAGEPTEAVPGATRRRIATLMGPLRTITRVAVWSIVAAVSLGQLGLDLTPILAGAGIAGLALSLAAQHLIRDVISGFFLVLEDQLHVGDVAMVNGTAGLVEAITFRTILLRDLAGAVHVFPHGAVTALANTTKGWSAYVIDVRVAYQEDTDQVLAVMRQADQELRGDPRYTSVVTEPIEIFGVDEFGDSGVTIKARLKTRPLQQWAVGREYRGRLKKAFEAAGIEIGYPHRSLHVGAATRPLPLTLHVDGAVPGQLEGARPQPTA
jgi:moderate conductance mechanosensitive channel